MFNRINTKAVSLITIFFSFLSLYFICSYQLSSLEFDPVSYVRYPYRFAGEVRMYCPFHEQFSKSFVFPRHPLSYFFLLIINKIHSFLGPILSIKTIYSLSFSLLGALNSIVAFLLFSYFF